MKNIKKNKNKTDKDQIRDREQQTKRGGKETRSRYGKDSLLQLLCDSCDLYLLLLVLFLLCLT